MSKHATLSPSSGTRWFNCPGSINLIGGRTSKSGPAALLGTEAHEYASEILLEKQDLADIPDDNMREAVTKYVEFVGNLEEGYESEFDYMVEELVDLRHLGGDCWGTLDYASWYVGQDLYIVDYKHGIVPVEPDTHQLKIYALGVLEKVGYDFRHIYCVIVQPRAAHTLGPIRSKRYTPVNFKAFRSTLKAAIKETKNEHATRESGEWCQYCPAIGYCPEISTVAQDIAKVEFADCSPGELVGLPDERSVTDNELAVILRHDKAFRAWLDACGSEAVERLEKGNTIGGLKLVRSSGRATWRAPDKLPKKFTTKKPITITEARAKFGSEVEQHITRPPGSIRAVDEADGRPEYIAAQVEFKK